MFMKRFTYVFGFTMAGIMALSLILPTLTGNNAQTQQPRVEPTAAPTFPPPPETSAIGFDQTYLHPSGLFTIAEPTGWQASQPLTTREGVRALLTNVSAQSLIQVDVDRPVTADEAALTLDDVDARFNEAWLGSSWREYTAWDESSRERTDDDRLVMDFELNLRGQTYVARQAAWTDGEWIYSVRVVTPQNATDTLLYVLDGVAESLQPQKIFASTPFNWNAYFDPQDTHIIRYPTQWELSDSAPGRPASITGQDATLRVEAETGTVIDSRDSASAWVETLRSGATILSVEPVSRDTSDGYAVSYSFKTVDGDSESGLAVLLNGPDETLHVANLQFPGNEVDLNATGDEAGYSDLVTVMNSFNVFPDLAGVDTSVTGS